MLDMLIVIVDQMAKMLVVKVDRPVRDEIMKLLTMITSVSDEFCSPQGQPSRIQVPRLLAHCTSSHQGPRQGGFQHGRSAQDADYAPGALCSDRHWWLQILRESASIHCCRMRRQPSWLFFIVYVFLLSSLLLPRLSSSFLKGGSSVEEEDEG